MLIDHLPGVEGNVHDIKVLSHKKTDKIDSEMITLLALKWMIEPSRVVSWHERNFRKIVRLRQFLIRKRTDIKNRIHSILDSELFHLSETLTDIIVVFGQVVVNGLLIGLPADKLLKKLPNQTKKKKEIQIRKFLEQSLFKMHWRNSVIVSGWWWNLERKLKIWMTFLLLRKWQTD